MPELKDIYARKKEASGQVSTLTRGLALGFLGISWTLFTAHDEPLHSMAANVNRYFIIFLAAASVLVITCDLLQYVAITRMAEETYRRAEKAKPQEASYDDSSFAYKAQAVLYHAKFWVLAAGSVLLVVIFGFLLLPVKTLPR
jgi:hypothetical protein